MLQACDLYLNTCGGPGSYRAGPTALLITCVSGAKNMKTQQKIKKLAILLLTITLVLGSLVTTAVAMPGMNTFWPMDYDASNATGVPRNSYTRVSISADEYPEVQELPILNDSKDELDLCNIFYIVVIPGLDTKSATRDKYALTLTLTERDGNAPTVKLAKANYYRPVQVKWTANDGRQCDLFIIATPEKRDYTDADYTEASIYYLESLNKVQSLYDTLSTNTKAVVGGYHPQNFRCLQKICRNYSGAVLSFGWSDAMYRTRLNLVQLGRIFPNVVRWRRTRRRRFLLIYFPIIWIIAGSLLKSRSYPACKSWGVKPLLYQIRNMRYICRREPIGRRLTDHLTWW